MAPLLSMLFPVIASTYVLINGTSTVHYVEHFLLHERISPAPLAGLKVWDREVADWRAPTTSERVARPTVTVLHLWSYYCTPCLAELPQVVKWAQRQEQEGKGAVRVLVVAHDTDGANMRSKWPLFSTGLPSMAALYQDPSGDFFGSIARKAPATNRPPLPLTVVLDKNFSIQYAIAGPLQGRFNELSDSIARFHESELAPQLQASR
jgi:thiol-disulfide isomerase/thioredoxin